MRFGFTPPPSFNSTPSSQGVEDQPFALNLNATVCSFYRAATAELPWQAVLDELCTGLGARALTLQTVRTSDGRVLGLQHGGAAWAQAALHCLRQWQSGDLKHSSTSSAVQGSLGSWLHNC